MDEEIAEALAAIRATLATVAPQHEGLKDFARLNIDPAALLEVRATLERFDRRVRLLEAAATALQTLVDDGPLGVRAIDSAVLQNLHEQATTIAAALGLFTTTAPATQLHLTAATPEPK